MLDSEEELRQRLTIFGLGPDERSLIRCFAGVAAGEAERIAQAYCRSIVERIPDLKPTVDMYGEALVRAEAAHFALLFAADFGTPYLTSGETTAQVEARSKLGARARLSVAHRLLYPLLKAVARRHWFSVHRAIRECSVIIRVLIFDVISAMSVEQRDQAKSVENRQRVLDESVRAFDVVLLDLHHAVGAASQDLSSCVHETKSFVEDGIRSTDRVEVATGEAADRVASMAAAANEVSASLHTIGQQTDSNLIAIENTVAASKQMSGSVAALTSAAGRIGSVVNVISSIAGQTNLLALNATIEAARAGEAGRGFSVVAGEVKELANKTTQATTEIGEQIKRVQSATMACSEQIHEIAAQIEAISAASRAVALAVAAQQTTTLSVVQNAQEAAIRSTRIREGAQRVGTVMSDTLQSADQIRHAIELLSSRMRTLDGSVEEFIGKIRTA